MRALLVVGCLSCASVVVAGPRDVTSPGAPSRDLYVQRRPLAPSAPLSKELRELIARTEQRSEAKTLEAIALLRELLASKPTGDVRADGLFKLAELVWDEARRTYLREMDAFTREVEACRRTACTTLPVEPRIDLAPAEKLYLELHDTVPVFPRMDLVTYLIGFAAQEAGRDEDAQTRFREVIDRFPKSVLVSDAWLMIGDQKFRASKYQDALAAYRSVRETAPAYDYALFKRAWCSWKLADTRTAAADFKEVIARGGKFRDEAIEYLVVVFTEDHAVSAKDVFAFVRSLDPTNTRDILAHVAESYASQAEWERSNETFRLLIELDPMAPRAAELARRIAQNWVTALDDAKAQRAIDQLLAEHGPASRWAKAQTDRDALARSLAATETLVRETATNLHASAQRAEKALGRATRDACAATTDLPANVLASYARAIDAYDAYLAAFPTSVDATATRFHRADILCFALGKLDAAGDAYMTVARTAPVGALHRDALRNAITAYDQARSDAKLDAAVDLYASLFRDAAALFQIGQSAYDRGAYDRAVKRFAVVVRVYPSDPNAPAAADRILATLATAGRYDELYAWTKELAATKLFAARDHKARLAKIMLDAAGKSAEKLAAAHEYTRAAQLFLEVHAQTRDAQALMNAGVMYERALATDRAVQTYSELATTYATTRADLAETAALAAARLHHKTGDRERAAAGYESAATTFPHAAPDALVEAAALRDALGQHERALMLLQKFAAAYPTHARAVDVDFAIAAAHEQLGHDGPANAAYAKFARAHATHPAAADATMRAARTAIKLGQLARAREGLAAVRRFKGAPPRVAAEARYLEGELLFNAFATFSLDVPLAKLTPTLAKQTKLLREAEATYAAVYDLRDARWSAAALIRTGEIYDTFADKLAEAAAHPPAGMPPVDEGRYQDRINEFVVAMQEKALSIYEVGYRELVKRRVFDDHTATLRKHLTTHAPDRYPPPGQTWPGQRLAPAILDGIVRRAP